MIERQPEQSASAISSPARPIDLADHVHALQAKLVNGCTVRHKGRVVSVRGNTIRVTGLPARIGQRCVLQSTSGDDADQVNVSHLGSDSLTPELEAEVIGFDGLEAILLPLGELHGLALGSEVTLSKSTQTVGVCDALKGRVLDGFGRALDDQSLPIADKHMPLRAAAPSPLVRQRVLQKISTGIKVIDTVLSIGQGQRCGVFAPAGAGKSTLLGMLAETRDVDVVVIALIGERGREVRDFLEDALSDKGRARSVCVVATSDRPAIERISAAHTATAIAEGYARDGKHVLLLVDSLTRYARAVREVGLAAGEPPVRQGFTPSVFAELPKLLERSGTAATGSITAFYTVLTDDEQANDPISEEVRSILDGNIILSRSLAERNHYPAIDVSQSISRLFPQLVSPTQLALASTVRRILAKFDEIELLVQVGEYRAGSDPVADKTLAVIDSLNAWLTQSPKESFDAEEMLEQLALVLDQQPQSST